MQTSDTILMVRPACFQFNLQTAESNAFQKHLEGVSAAEIQQKAQAEFDAFVAKLREKGVTVIVIDDTAEPVKPDAVFPNNWISFHENGVAYLYPMFTPNRRLERRKEVIDEVRKNFYVREVRDISGYEEEDKILEGTGSIVFDHQFKIAYACTSPRTDKKLFEKYCQQIGYKPISFLSLDENEQEIYHTNVVMCVGEGFSVICLNSIISGYDRRHVMRMLQKNGDIVAITHEQMAQFAGNMLQVHNAEGKKYLVMSQTAYNALTNSQIEQLSKHTEILPVSIPTIETLGGGSARCMMAEVFCERKK
jgi:hypothetical protein